MKAPSLCDRCGGVFNHLTDELAYFRRGSGCQSCGAAAHWEQKSDQTWLAWNTPPGSEYQVVARRGRPLVKVFPERSLGSSPLTGGEWVVVGRRRRRKLYAIPAARRIDELRVPREDPIWPAPASGGGRLARYRVKLRAQEIPASAPVERVRDLDGTWIDAGTLLNERHQTIFDLHTVPPHARTFFVVDALMRRRTRFRDRLVERREGFRRLDESVEPIYDDTVVSLGTRRSASIAEDWIPIDTRKRIGEETRVDLFRTSSVLIEKAGSTGNAPHRPAMGVRGEDLIAERVRRELDELDIFFSLVELKATIRRGRLNEIDRVAHDELARLVWTLRQKPRPVNAQSLGDHLGCDRSTIKRLRDRGEVLLQQKSPKKGAVVPLSA